MRTPINGGDSALESELFTQPRDYRQFHELALKHHGDTENYFNVLESAWFRATLEFLYLRGYVLTKREAA